MAMALRVVVMAVAMVMIVIVVLTVVMIVAARLCVVVRVVAWTALRTARVLAEHERLDRHRHRVRRHAHAAEVDVVEVPEDDAVDREHFRGDAPLVLEERADRLRDVAVEDEHQRLRSSAAPSLRPRSPKSRDSRP